MTQASPTYDQAPLISARFIWKMAGVITLICLTILAISVAGRIIGRSIVLAGHTTDRTLREIVIGNDVLRLPANVIRFEAQRVSGIHQAIDAYFVWPGMDGYSESASAAFNQMQTTGSLIFARIAQSTMSRDMSGRFDPIYRRLVEGAPVAGPAGLVSYRLKPGTGYNNELLYVDEAGGQTPYAVRCLIDEAGADRDFITRTGCQRDIAIGHDLSLNYRFSIDLLPQWRQIEKDLREWFDTALADESQASGSR